MPEFIKTYNEMQSRIGAWSVGLLAGNETALIVTARTRHWYYSPAHNSFAPSKFIGYADISLDDFIPHDLDGRDTQGAIRRIGEYRDLTDDYPHAESIRAALEALVDGQASRLKKGAQIHVPELNPLRQLMISLNFAKEFYSYKLVFIQAILDSMESDDQSVQERIWNFYRERKAGGFTIERDGSVVLGFDLENYRRGEINSLASSAMTAVNNACGADEAVLTQDGTYRFAPAIEELLPQDGDELRYYLEARLRDYYENLNRPTRSISTNRESRFVNRNGNLRADWLQSLPDANQRTQVAEIFIDAINRAHAIAPGCWMISYKPRIPYINLNIGRLFAFTVRPGHISVLLDSTMLDLTTLPDSWSKHSGKMYFKVVAEATWRRGPTNEILDRWDSLRPSFESAVDKAAGTSRRSPWWRNHTREMVEILREETGQELPDADLPVEDTPSMATMIELIEEFLESYPKTPEGQDHYRSALSAKKEFLDSFAKLKADRAAGRDITDEVLLKLLPHGDFAGNRARGAWIFPAPVITKDIKQWFEGAGWAKQKDWPVIADLIMGFFTACEADPANLENACKTFAERIPAKGFQAGVLSPGLSCLNPEAFCVVNKKPLMVLKWYAGVQMTSNLLAYPKVNKAMLDLVEVAQDSLLASDDLDGLHPTSRFDTFTHWLVAIRKPMAQSVRYWKIAPGDKAWNWETCLSEGVITIGWDKVGDVSALHREEFDSLVSQIAEEDSEYSVAGTSQLWTFANEIQPGDRVLANHGKQRVVGVGTVIGEYRFEPGVRHGHQLPVDWDQTEPFDVPTQGWQKTIVRLKKPKFDEILSLAGSSGVNENDQSADTGYWLFQANPKVFDLARELQIHNNEALDRWRATRYAKDMRVGDKVILWQAGKAAGIYGIAEITGECANATAEDVAVDKYLNFGEPMAPIRILEVLDKPITKAEILNHELLNKMQVLRSPQGTIFRVTAEEWAAIEALLARAPTTAPVRPLEAIADATGFELPELKRWVNAINRKGQGILYGPPGTGKTYVARHLAEHIIGGTDGFLDLVQFHPAYTYEDFIQGLRPEATASGALDYRLVPGRFLEFCRKAEKRQGKCVLILDEINRANLARVFGELMYLLEYRDQTVPLANGSELAIPENVRIIGTMNTADRSIALVDHALRRRFAFIALHPQYHILEKYHKSRGYDATKLIKILQNLNLAINDHHYAVGISYFLCPDLDEHLEDIWRMEIEPYLEEYFFDQAAKAKEFRWNKIEGGLS